MDELTTIGATELHRSLSKTLKRVYVGKERLKVERGGFPVAVLIPYQDFEELLRLATEVAQRQSQSSKRKKTNNGQ